jgi:hypothetical protein
VRLVIHGCHDPRGDAIGERQAREVAVVAAHLAIAHPDPSLNRTGSAFTDHLTCREQQKLKYGGPSEPNAGVTARCARIDLIHDAHSPATTGQRKCIPAMRVPPASCCMEAARARG